jgi:hypothetical protein
MQQQQHAITHTSDTTMPFLCKWHVGDAAVLWLQQHLHNAGNILPVVKPALLTHSAYDTINPLPTATAHYACCLHP